MIEGLTTGEMQLPRIGTVRKGAPMETKDGKTRIGKDLNYFRIVTTDEKAASVLLKTFGDKPTDLRVYLWYPTAAQNFEAWREYWKAGGLVHRCTGTKKVLYRKGGGYSDEPARCEFADHPDREKLCKPVGRLSVLFRELGRAATFTVLTSSKNDIISLTNSLRAAEFEAHAQGVDGMAGIPFLLSRRDAMVGCPTDNADGRARRKKSLLYMEIHPDWYQLRLAAAEQQARPQLYAAPAALEIDGDPDEPDNDDVIEGEIEPAPERRPRGSRSAAKQAADIEPPHQGDDDDERPPGPPESAPGMDNTRRVQLETAEKFAALKRVSAEGHAVGLFNVGIPALNTTQLSALIKHLAGLPAPDEVSATIDAQVGPTANTQDASPFGDQAQEPGLFSTEADKFKEADRLLAKLAATGYFGKGPKAPGAWLLKNFGASELVNLRGPKLDLVLNQLLDLDAAGVGASAGAG